MLHLLKWQRGDLYTIVFLLWSLGLCRAEFLRFAFRNATVEPAEKTARSTENSAFRYKINILEVLKEIGYTSTRIRKEKIFAQVTLQKFRTGDTNISLQTVADICNLTGLQPWDRQLKK